MYPVIQQLFFWFRLDSKRCIGLQLGPGNDFESLTKQFVNSIQYFIESLVMMTILMMTIFMMMTRRRQRGGGGRGIVVVAMW